MRQKILILQYRDILLNVISFLNKENVVDFVLTKMHVEFLEPEHKIMK